MLNLTLVLLLSNLNVAAEPLENRADFAIPLDLSELVGDSYPRINEMTADELNILSERISSYSIPERVAIYAHLQAGTPYKGGALGEEQLPDTDPFIRYDVTDCTILNLISVSLAHSDSTSSPRVHMAKAGYSPDTTPSYRSRLHFTTDRLDVSPYFEDVTEKFGKALTKKVILNRKPDGSHWVPIDWERPRKIRYIPASEAGQIKDYPEILGVAFLKEKFLDKGLDVLHEGLLYRGKQVIHGSSKNGKVVVESYEDMLSRYDGVVLFSYK